MEPKSQIERKWLLYMISEGVLTVDSDKFRSVVANANKRYQHERLFTSNFILFDIFLSRASSATGKTG